MVWLSAEKQALIIFEFFNRIDPKRTLDEIISTPENNTNQSLMVSRLIAETCPRNVLQLDSIIYVH
jgi:hypothetical protein